MPVFKILNTEITLNDYYEKSLPGLKIIYQDKNINDPAFVELAISRIKKIKKFYSFITSSGLMVDRKEALRQIIEYGEFRDYILQVEMEAINIVCNDLYAYKNKL